MGGVSSCFALWKPLTLDAKKHDRHEGRLSILSVKMMCCTAIAAKTQQGHNLTWAGKGKGLNGDGQNNTFCLKNDSGPFNRHLCGWL